MANNSIGPNASMPSIGNMNPQSGIQYVNNPLQSPQIQATSLSSPSQHSPMGTQALIGTKANQVSVGGGGGSSSDQTPSIVTRPRLQELVREVDPTIQLDEDVEDTMLQMADDFLDTVLASACSLTKHRHWSIVETRDVSLLLERQWNMWIPGFGNDEIRPYKRAAVTEAHKQRMALIRKTSKKY